MTDVVFYFQVHQPFRLRRYSFFDIGASDEYFDDSENERILRRVAERGYGPMNRLVLDLIQRLRGRFRVAYSISGTALDQLEAWSPETLESFQRLSRTGCVEFLAETSQHSLAGLFDLDVFRGQVRAHARRIEELFGRRPTTFRNTELVIDETIAREVEALGFDVLLGEGADRLLGWRSPRHVYRPRGTSALRLLLRDYRFSDDIAFRYSNRTWSEWPLTVEKFTDWLAELPAQERYVGLFMDYETFGEHQWADTGIFEFMAGLPEALLAGGRFRFRTPSEAARAHEPVGELAFPDPLSWADAERDVTAWLGNPMQRAANEALYALAPRLAQLEGGEHERLVRSWQRLSTSDHLYYMCTKWFSDGDVHKYFSPYQTPHDAFIVFMNVIDDLTHRMERVPPARSQRTAAARIEAARAAEEEITP